MSTKSKPEWQTQCEKQIAALLTYDQLGDILAKDSDEVFDLFFAGFILRYEVNEPLVSCGLAAYAVMRYLQDHPELAERGERTVVA